MFFKSVSAFAVLVGMFCVPVFAAGDAPAAAPTAPPAIIEGTWLTQKQSEITIAACDQGFCGYLSKIVVPEDIKQKYKDQLAEIGTNFTDQMNKDPALRNRPIQNLQILTLKPGDNPWKFEGEVYSPEDGNTYVGYIDVLGPDKIKLTGCGGPLNLICLGEEWSRVPPPEEAPAGAADATVVIPAPAPTRQR
jgi:uncharacterized protein (DUF2147 family)